VQEMAGILYLGGGREGQQNKQEEEENRKVACFCSETRRSTATARGLRYDRSSTIISSTKT
jgi:hypothetical protein